MMMVMISCGFDRPRAITLPIGAVVFSSARTDKQTAHLTMMITLVSSSVCTDLISVASCEFSFSESSTCPGTHSADQTLASNYLTSGAIIRKYACISMRSV